MSDLDKFNYECGVQMSLFSGMLKEQCDTKPDIGTELVFHYEGKDYPCVVTAHCGFDFFYVKLSDAKPHDNNPKVENTEGWHLSLRGYKKDWDFPEVMP